MNEINGVISNEEKLEKQLKKQTPSRDLIFLLIALLLIFSGAFLANLVNTNGYKTDIFDFTIPTDNGQYIVGTVYKPKTATATSKAPCVVFVPGFQRTKESHYDLSLEFARRGIVCFIIDPYNQGDSTASYNTSSSSDEAGAYGAIPLVNYLYDTNNVNYIDKDNISICGHSAGGNSALTAAVYFSNLCGGVYENCKIKSVYISGYIRNIIDVNYETDENGDQLFAKVDENGNYITENVLDENGNIVTIDGEKVTKRIYTTKEEGILSLDGDDAVGWEAAKASNLCINLGFGYSDIDEGAWQNINLTGDITRPDSYEALSLITSGGVHTELRKTGLESGHVYGQASEGTMRVGFQEHCYHGMQPFDVKATSHIMYFYDMVFELDTISPNNQIWMWKQFSSLVLMVGLFMLIFPVTGLLLKCSVFKSITFKHEEKQMPKKAKPWIIFAITLICGALVACFSFVPLADLSKVLFKDAAAHKVTWFYPERMNNSIMLWAVVNGCFGFVLFFLSWFINGRKESLKEHFGIGFVNLLKTLLCAFLVWLSFYVMVHIVDYIFNIDGRFTFVAIRTTNKRYLVYMLEYLPFFFIFYLSNSVRVNLSAHTNNSSKRFGKFLQYALAVAANTIGLFTIFAIQYVSIGVNGLMFWTTNWLFTNMLWILIPLMFILPIFQKIIYKKSGNIYLGAMITCLIFITISMCNSVAHGPFAF